MQQCKLQHLQQCQLSGWPVEGECTSVTVWGEQGELSDYYAHHQPSHTPQPDVLPPNH